MGFFQFVYTCAISLNTCVCICAYTGNTLGLSLKNVNFIAKQKHGKSKYIMKARVMFVCYIAATEIELILKVF